MEQYLTLKDVCGALKISRRTVERLVYQKQLVVFKLGQKKRSSLRFRLSDLNKFIERNKAA